MLYGVSGSLILSKSLLSLVGLDFRIFRAKKHAANINSATPNTQASTVMSMVGIFHLAWGSGLRVCDVGGVVDVRVRSFDVTTDVKLTCLLEFRCMLAMYVGPM